MVCRLDPQKIPPGLHQLIPLAERFGITDDLSRERLVQAAPPEQLAELKGAVVRHAEDLDNWLSGPDADGPKFSAEYLAFSAMRMAADFA